MQQDKLVIVLADISGYTRFMVENRTSAVHGQVCINALIEAILSHVDIPLTLQEIEGDAVFLYARSPGSEPEWRAMAEEISDKLDGFFTAFIAQMGVTGESTPCGCAICRNSDKLGLKIIVHAGEAVFHEVAGRPQVSGPDVILAHRLLKNSVDGNEYLLLTESAYQLMSARLDGEFHEGQETYDGFEPVRTRTRHLDRDVLVARDLVYELNEPQRAAAVESYLDWVQSHIGSAAWQQMRAPIRSFSWRDRLLMTWEAVVAFRLFRRRVKKSILATQKARGRRREAWGPADKLPS